MSGPEQHPVLARSASSGSLTVPSGYRVGPWEVGEPLGAGGFGSVYAGRGADVSYGADHTTGTGTGTGTDATGAGVALKFLPTGTRTPRQLRHLRELADREIALLSTLRAPRLIRLHDVLTVDDPAHPELDGATVLVLERAERSLDTLLAGDGAPPGRAAGVLTDVLEGLHQLHGAGWVHGDLKPANVLLMADGTTRLADFNLSAQLEDTHAYSPAFTTPDYTPPELLWADVGERGIRTRPTTDIWAFGVLAHLVLTGSLPLPGTTPAARRDATARYARGREELRLSPRLPAGWRQIVADCLAPTHEQRAAHDALSLLHRARTAGDGPEADGPDPAAGGDRPTAAARPEHRPGGAPGREPGQGARRRRRASRRLLAGAAVLAAVGSGALWIGLAPRAGAEGYERCIRSAVCLFSEHGGRGEMCSWIDADDDWLDDQIACPWMARKPPRSIFNNGYGPDMGALKKDVEYFERPGLTGFLACLPVQTRTDLDPSVRPRSHRWVAQC
ncbi:serine/threonine-protein kinase [Kitasatospora sp. NPDC002965]|uniref:serine/threonine-protein kinase n=1 Tax=Kitasatospora sp. NPDC002965 TaxID=3154775 RepID=UPI0033B7F899